MRRENLLYDKVIWKRSRDRCRDKASRQRNSETRWRRTTATLLGVSFETYLRRRGDVLMGRRHYVPMGRHHDIPIRRREDVPLRRLGDVPLRRRWVFHLRRTCDVTGTYREMSLRRRHDVLLPGGYVVLKNFSETLSLFHWVLIKSCLTKLYYRELHCIIENLEQLESLGKDKFSRQTHVSFNLIFILTEWASWELLKYYVICRNNKFKK